MALNNLQQRSSAKKRVALTIDFERLTVPATCLSVLRPLLALRERMPTAAPDGTLKIGSRDQVIYWQVGNTLQMSPGFRRRVQVALERSGYHVVVSDKREYRQPYLPAAATAAEANPEQRRMLTCVSSAERGQLLLRRAPLKTALLIHDYYPDTRTLLVVSTETKAVELRERLERQRLEPVEIPSGSKHPRARLCIAFTRRFAQGVNFTPDMRWGLVLFLGVDAATSRASVNNWQLPLFARKYVLHDRSRLSSNQRLLLEHAAGPLIYRQPAYHEPVPEVTVETLTPPTLTAASGLNPLERKRHFLWNNARRNRLIADIAAAFAAADLRRLQRLDLAVHEDAAVWNSYGGHLDTVVVVESVAHALELRKLLPNWKVRTTEPPTAKPAKAQPATWESYGQARAIITFGWLQRNGLAADVVIRADGTATRWDVAWGAHPDVTRQSGVMRLVDVQDDFDDAARKDAATRLDTYKCQGWMDQRLLTT